MLFNVNKPATQGQLAALYTGNPNMTPEQVDSNLFMSSAQGHGYIQEQGRNLGIGDPAQYYSAQQLARTMSTQKTGADMEFARLSGQFDPNSLPGQLQKQQQRGDALMAVDQLKAQQVAALQNQQRQSAFPLPSRGMAPQLSPVMQEDMRQRGISNPMEYILGQRLGGMASPSVASGVPLSKPVASVAGLTSAVDPDSLYNAPSFQNAMTQNGPESANIFSGLTGKNLATYHQNYLKSAEQERAWKVKSLRDDLSNGRARYEEDGSLSFREMIPDPSGSGKLVLGPNYGRGDSFQQSLNKILPYADSDVARLQTLARKKALDQGTVTPSAALPAAALPAAAVQGVPSQLRANNSPSPVFDDTVNGMFGDLGRVFTGGEQTWLGGTEDTTQRSRQFAHGAGDFVRPQGRAITHARPALANNPQFQELLRRDPDKARAIIQAIQMGDNSPMQRPERAYPYMQ